MFPVTTIHIQVEIPGGFTASLSLKITSAEMLAELGQSLERCGIKPHTPGKNTMPPVNDKSSEPSPALPETPAKTPEIKIQRAETAHINPSPATETDNYPPMPTFIPQNVTEIIDIEARDKYYIGKTEDGTEIKIDNLHQKQMTAIGYDTSTWDRPEPYIAEPIIVSLNTFPKIQQIKNPDGIWTWVRAAANVKADDVLCLKADDGNISYHKIKANKRMMIEFADDHPPIENNGFVYICLKEQDIPF